MINALKSNPPVIKLSRAAVIKTLKTFLKTVPSVIPERDPEELHETMSIAWKVKVYLLNIHKEKLKKIFTHFRKRNYLESKYKKHPHSIKTSKYVQKCAHFNKIGLGLSCCTAL
jgi:hypothetical protein